MNYTVSHTDSYMLVRLEESHLHAAHTPDLKAEFIQLWATHPLPVIIDMAPVQTIDSSILSAFLLLKRQLEEKNIPMYIINLQPHVQKIFNISKLDTIFMLMHSLDDALKALALWQAENASVAPTAKRQTEEDDEEEWEEEDLEEEDWEDEDWEDEDWEDEEWEDEEWDEEEWEDEEEEEEEKD